MGRFLLVGAFVLFVAGCGGSTTTQTVTTSGSSSPQTTSLDELARIQVAASQWSSVDDAIVPGAKRCHDRARAGIESYESCRAQQLEGVDKANAELAETFATLSPAVDPTCGNALESAAHQVAAGKALATPDHAVSVCRQSVAD